MTDKDAPTVEEVLDHADLYGTQVRSWFTQETERRRAERLAQETGPVEYMGTTLVVGQLYRVTLRHSRKRRMRYEGWFRLAWYGKGGPVFRRLGDDGLAAARQWTPYAGDVLAIDLEAE